MIVSLGKQQMGGGGKTYHTILGAGERTTERGLQNKSWRVQKVGLFWSVPVPFKEYDHREGANREKLTVKKFIDNEMFFFSPFMSLTNREKSA